MAYEVRIGHDRATYDAVAAALRHMVDISRFTADIGHEQRPWHGHVVTFETVRLRVSKHYCGNHAGPCLRGGGSHRKARFLEGTDWASFNDMVNDTLDAMRVCADVQSSHCVIRIGERRCIEYVGGNGGEWIKHPGDHCFANHIGDGPQVAKVPNGTPGIQGYTQAANMLAKLLETTTPKQQKVA